MPNTDLHDLLFGSLYLGLIALAGYAILCGILKSGGRSWAELLGFSFACGCGVVSLILFVVSIAGVIPIRITLGLIALGAVISLIVTRKTKGLLIPAVPDLRFTLEPTVFLGGFGLALISMSVFGVVTRTGWPALENVDVFAIWLLKAKWVAIKPLLPIPPEFLDPSLSYSHQDYPLAFPFLVAGLWAMLGRIDDSILRIIVLPIYLALICVMYSAVRRQTRRSLAIAITAIFVATPILAQNAGWAVPETFLLLCYTCALALLVRWMKKSQRGDLVLAAIFMTIFAFTKNEGLALLPAIGLATLVLTLSKRNLQHFISWICAGFLCLILITPWLIYRTWLPRTHEDYGSKLTSVATILHNLPRLAYVLPIFIARIFTTSEVGPLGYLLLLMAIAGWKGFFRGPVLFLWSILLIQFCLYIGAFVVTPWDIHILVPMVTSRLLTQASPVAALLISLHLRELPWPADKPA